MRINCNFVTMLGLTNDERRLIQNLCVKKHYKLPKELWKCFQMSAFILWMINSKCLSCSNSSNCAVYPALYILTWSRFRFLGPPRTTRHCIESGTNGSWSNCSQASDFSSQRFQIILMGCVVRTCTVFTATCFSNVAVMPSLDVRLSVCPSVCP